MACEKKVRISAIWLPILVFIFLVAILWFAASVTKAEAKVDEFIIVTSDNGEIWYLQSKGDGSFANRTKITTIGSYVKGAGIADFDNDKDFDFVAGDSTGKIYLFNNTGLGTFNFTTIASGLSFGTTSYCMDFAVEDFNNDGYYDFVVSGNNNVIYIFTNNKNSTFNYTTISATWATTLHGKAAGDYNTDTFKDFIVNSGDGKVYLYANNGSGGFTGRSTTTISMTNPYALTSGDFNNDGKLDIVFGGDTTGKIYLWIGSGDGNFTSFSEIYDFGETTAIDSYDFDNDNNEDIIGTLYNSRSVYFLRGRGNGQFDAPLTVTSGLELGSILGISAPNRIPDGKPIARAGTNQTTYVNQVVTFNGNSSTDADGNIVEYNWSFGDGTYGAGISTTHTYTKNGVYTVNLTATDNMGYKSIARVYITVKNYYRREYVVTGNDSGGLHIFLSKEDGTFETKRFVDTIGSNVRGIGIADFDNDMDYDFIVGSGDDSVYLFVNDGYENFTKTKILKGHLINSTNIAQSGRVLSSAGHYNDVAGGVWYTSGTVDYHTFNLIDGDKSTNTNAYWLENEATSKLYIDLNSKKLVGKIFLDNHNQHSTTCSYAVYYNNNDWDGNWATVGTSTWVQVDSVGSTGSLGTNADTTITLNTYPHTRFIRVDITRTSGSWAVLNEIEIYEALPTYVGPFGSNVVMDITVGDFNNDGYKDFAISGLDTNLRVFLNNHDYTFVISQEMVLADKIYGKGAGDFVGDNNTDILVGCKDKKIYLLEGYGNGTFINKGSIIDLSGNNTDEPYTIAVGDFKKDGYLDILVGGDSDGKVWLYLGNTTKGGWPIYFGLAYSFVSSYQSGKAYDFENDGILDVIAVTDTNNSIYKIKGNGDGTFRMTADKIIMPDLIDSTIGKALGVAVPDAPYPNKPTANAGVNQSGYINTPISFNGFASSSSATQYIWNFGDGTTGYGAVLQHNYTRNGVYNVTLTVKDQYGYAGSSRITVTVKALSRQGFIVATNDAGEVYYLKSNGDGTFGNKTLVDSIGSNVRGVCIADFDGDYDYDFVIGTYTGTTTKGEVYLYKNDGYQNFTKNKIATGIALGGNYANDFAVGDFNNDNYTDFIFSGNDNIIRIFLNNRDDTFSQSTITASWESNRLLGKDVGDFNNDGKLDFIVSGYGTASSYGNVYIYAGNGDGTFTDYWKVLNMSGENEVRKPWTLIDGDFDNDGKLDLIIGGDGDTNDDSSASSNSVSDGRVYLYLGDGNGNFTYTRVAYDFVDTYQSADAYDFDGDGNLDILVATYTNKSLFLVRGKGNGLFSTRLDRLVMPDILVYDLGNVLGIAAPNLSPTNKPVVVVSAPQTIFLGDTATFNATASTCINGVGNYSWNFGDGDIGYGSVVTHKYSKNGAYNLILTLTDGFGYKSIGRTVITVRIYTPKEFIIVSNDVGELYYFNITNGTLEGKRLIATISTNVRSVAVADFDSDGDFDFVTADSSNSVYFFINDGTETFGRTTIGVDYPTGTLTLSSVAMGFAAGDLNGDGYSDFVMSGNTNILRIFTNNKDGSFEQSTVSGDSGVQYRSKAIADVNGDSFLDILASDNKKNVYVFNGTRNGTFGNGWKVIDLSSISLSTDNIYTLQCADFDGDSKTDVLVGGSTNGRVWFYKGDGKGNFTYSRQAYNFTAYLQSAASFDVDKDGVLDLIAVVYDEHTIYFIKGGSNGMFYNPLTISSDIGTAKSLGISAPPTRSVPANFNVWGESIKNGFAGDTILYNLTIENNCSISDIVDISYTSKYGFPYSISKAIDSSTVPLNDTDNDGFIDTGTLSQNGGRIQIVVTLIIPSSAPAGAIDILNITLNSSVDKITFKKFSIETTVKTTPKVSLTTESLVADGKLGSVVIYNLTIKNEGNIQDTINVNISGYTWDTHLFSSDGITALTNTNPATDSMLDVGTVSPGSNKSVLVKVTIPDMPSRLNDSIIIFIQSTIDTTKNSTITLTTNTNPIRIFGDTKTATGNQNEVISFLLGVANAGESGFIDVIPVSSNNWNAALDYINGSHLADTNHNGILNLSKGNTTTIMANITIPSDAKGGTVEKTTITISSQYGKTDAIILAIVVNRPNITVIAPAASQSGIPTSKCSYNITVTNIGNTIDTINIEALSTLNWSVQLYRENGTLLNDTNSDGLADVGSLDIAASATFIAVVTIPPGAQASIINNATIAASSSVNRNVKYATYLSTISLQYMGFDLGPDQSKNADPGDTISYSVIVRNNGNDKDTIKLKTSAPLPNWYITLLKRDYLTYNYVTIEDTGELPPGSSLEVFVRVVIPTNETAYTVEKTKLNGTSTRDPYLTNIIELATTVNVVAKVSLSVNKTVQKIDAGGSVAYYLDITNNGNFKDTINIETNNTSPNWKINVLQSTGSDISSFPNTGVLSIGEKTTIIVKVTAPAADITNYTDATVITVRSTLDKRIFERVVLNTNISRFAKMDVVIDNLSKTANPGELVSYLITITNKGVNPDVFDILVLSSNWTASILNTLNESLIDTNNNGNVDTGTIQKDSSAPVIVKILIPQDVVAQATDWFVIKFVSSENSSIVKQITLTTVADKHGRVNITSDLNISADPNEDFTQVITIANNQNYDDFISLTPKGVPEKWNLSFYMDDWTPIKDTNQDATLDVGTIRVGGTVNIKVVFSIPASAIHGSQNTIDIDVYSSTKNAVVNTTQIKIGVNRPEVSIKEVVLPTSSVFERDTIPLTVLVANDGAYAKNIVINITSSTGKMIGATVVPSIRRGQVIPVVVNATFAEIGSLEFTISIEGLDYDINTSNNKMGKTIEVAPTSKDLFSSAGLALIVIMFAIVIAIVSILFVRQNIMRKYDEWRSGVTGGKRFRRLSHVSKYEAKEYSPYTTPVDDSTAFKAYETYVPMIAIEEPPKTSPPPTEQLKETKKEETIQPTEKVEKKDAEKQPPAEPLKEIKKWEVPKIKTAEKAEIKETEKPPAKPKEAPVLKIDTKALKLSEKKEVVDELSPTWPTEKVEKKDMEKRPPIEPLKEIKGAEVPKIKTAEKAEIRETEKPLVKPQEEVFSAEKEMPKKALETRKPEIEAEGKEPETDDKPIPKRRFVVKKKPPE
jgi:chitodextrinase